jgi:hypothetical protein
MKLPLILLKSRGLIDLLVISVQPSAELKVVKAKEIAEKFLKKLEEVIQDSKNSLSKLKKIEWLTLKLTIQSYSELFPIINCYLKSKPELEALKVIISINLDYISPFGMMEVGFYLNYRMQIQLTQDLVNSIKSNKLTRETNKRLLISAENSLKESQEIYFKMGVYTFEYYLIKITKLNDSLRKVAINKLTP